MDIQTYIKDRKALKWAVLAREIGWDKSSFHQWMNGVRKIPQEKENKLRLILQEKYGLIL